MQSSMQDDATRRRLGRAVLFILQQAPTVTNPVVRADIATLLLAGQAMDFATKLQGHGSQVSGALAREYARQGGLGERDLLNEVLPKLKKADVVDYRLDTDGKLLHVDEFVGVTSNVIEQTFQVLHLLNPSDPELAVLHSVEIAAWAPLAESQHLDQITRRGLGDAAAAAGLRLALAVGINRRIPSAELSEDVIFNPHVWGTGQVKIAEFLRNLPPNERDVLLGLCEQASSRPGILVDQLGAAPSVLASARKVGLVQAATVKSSLGGGRSKTYVFSPLSQTEDDLRTTTEALHLRKLFVAHILFGKEQAEAWGGRIQSPTVLVRALLDRGQVGPASNIATDYHLVEAHGIVRVEETNDGRGVLKLIKKEVVEGGLDWLTAHVGNMPTGGPVGVNLRHAPGTFVTPEGDRAAIPDDAAADEVTRSAVLSLREEAQRAARLDSPFGF
ncbi:hypothetical protein ACIBO1_07780 [Micromonospora sp. NPDC049903]|uniref:hypothetical protein n=1 Tax=Micromonospora sp. NPDC049903 TaxID=3364276 RepID=UPI00379C3D20